MKREAFASLFILKDNYYRTENYVIRFLRQKAKLIEL